MNSFLIASQLVLFLVVLGAAKKENKCVESGDCPGEPPKLSPLEQASQNITCEDVKAWFERSDKETNNKKYTLFAGWFGVAVDAVARFGSVVNHKAILGKTDEPLSIPTELFKKMTEQFNAKWNGTHYVLDCGSYFEISVSINYNTRLIYNHHLLTNYYETSGKECVLKVTDNKSIDEYHLSLPAECRTNFDRRGFPSSSRDDWNKQINVPAKGWSNNKHSPSKQEDKGSKKGRRTQHKGH